MGSAENGGSQHPAPEGHQIGTPPHWDVYDTFPIYAPKNDRYAGCHMQLCCACLIQCCFSSRKFSINLAGWVLDFPFIS